MGFLNSVRFQKCFHWELCHLGALKVTTGRLGVIYCPFKTRGTTQRVLRTYVCRVYLADSCGCQGGCLSSDNDISPPRQCDFNCRRIIATLLDCESAVLYREDRVSTLHEQRLPLVTVIFFTLFNSAKWCNGVASICFGSAQRRAPESRRAFALHKPCLISSHFVFLLRASRIFIAIVKSNTST